MTDVAIVCWNTPAESDRRARQIARFMGADASFVQLDGTALRDTSALRSRLAQYSCLVVDAQTLARMAGMMGGPAAVSSLIGDVARYIFIYGFEPTIHDELICSLSSSALRGVRPQTDEDARVQVEAGHAAFCGPFSGLTLQSVNAVPERCFVDSPGLEPRQVLIRCGEAPFLVRLRVGRSDVFVAGSRELADLDEGVPRPARPLAWFTRLMPLMMVLRGALGRRVWRNDNPRACFIIDDPLLKRRYGFLEFTRLIEATHRQRFSTSIAFIPWNYRRSAAEVAALLAADRTHAPSLCVHGCDHIEAEFETSDVDALRVRAQRALERMRAHERLSGVPFDDVMVFPRGRFSAEAVSALKAADYLATVNGDVWPARMPHTLQDLLEVAVTRFSEFPLFSRRYPRDLAEFALDLFVGKPVMAVEHHGYFRDGYDALTMFVERLQSLEPRLEWTNLSTICSRASLTRTTDEGDIQVRFYTNRFSMRNGEPESRSYTLVRRYAADAPAPSVLVNGRDNPFVREGDQLKLAVRLGAGEGADVAVASRTADSAEPPRRVTAIENVRVGSRRLLGEFRDNYIDTSRALFGRRTSPLL